MIVGLPPAALLAGAAIVQHLGDRRGKPTARSVAVATPLAAASAWFLGGSLREFRRHSTTVDPRRPAAARALVTGGPNRFTRNPMYVGMAGLLAAHAVGRQSVRALVPAAAFVALIDRGQIRAEEAALRGEFGAAFDQYVGDTPRWLGGSPALRSAIKAASRAKSTLMNKPSASAVTVSPA